MRGLLFDAENPLIRNVFDAVRAAIYSRVVGAAMMGVACLLNRWKERESSVSWGWSETEQTCRQCVLPTADSAAEANNKLTVVSS